MLVLRSGNVFWSSMVRTILVPGLSFKRIGRKRKEVRSQLRYQRDTEVNEVLSNPAVKFYNNAANSVETTGQDQIHIFS